MPLHHEIVVSIHDSLPLHLEIVFSIHNSPPPPHLEIDVSVHDSSSPPHLGIAISIGGSPPPPHLEIVVSILDSPPLLHLEISVSILDSPPYIARHSTRSYLAIGGNETRPATTREIGALASDLPWRRNRLDAAGAAVSVSIWAGSGRGVVGNAASSGMGVEEEEETAVGREGGGCGGEGEVGGGDGAADKGESAAAVVSCSICLEAVVAGCEGRSTARLQCGHEFHLDCIGSAFNVKGVMQCPNCRKIEKGNWLYASGSRPSQDVNTDEWGHDEDLYDFSYAETTRGIFLPLRFQWCPIGRLAQLPSLPDEGESSPPVTFHDFMGQNFTSEHLAASAPGATHPAPYIAYFQPVPPAAPSSSSHVTERTTDGSTYHDHWNSLAGPSDGRPLQTVHPIDFHHNHWAHMLHSYAQPNSNNGVAEQPGVPVGAIRVGGLDGDSQQRGSLPSVYGNGSGSRSRIPSVPPLAPQFLRAHGNIIEQHLDSSRLYTGFEYHPRPPSIYAGSQLSGGMRRPGPVVVPPLPLDLFPPGPPGPPGSSSMETDDAGGNQFYAWERDRFAPYPLIPVDSEASWWGSSQQPQGTPEPAAAAAAAPRRLFGQGIGVGGRSPPPPPPPENRSPENSSFRPMHIPRM